MGAGPSRSRSLEEGMGSAGVGPGAQDGVSHDWRPVAERLFPQAEARALEKDGAEGKESWPAHLPRAHPTGLGKRREGATPSLTSHGRTESPFPLSSL